MNDPKEIGPLRMKIVGCDGGQFWPHSSISIKRKVCNRIGPALTSTVGYVVEFSVGKHE